MTNKEWEKLRQECLERDKQCRGSTMCGQRCDKEVTDVHHIKPKKKGGKDVIENLVALCKRHHSIADNTYFKYGKTRMAKIWIEENEK